MITAILNRLVGIRSGTDIESTVRTIHSGIPLKGYNLWMLVCSAALASLGLDTNSTAVIIGAMLISPLMSPILGVGLSLGTNDRPTLIESARNLALATAVSLGTSWIYFVLTPLGEATNELLSRTQPTLLDVLVAFFGGVAGIVSISRREASNAIPGVAIATALMPPLCTAGFGLASGNWSYFFGAMYLFIINSVFISIATFTIVKYLHFPVVAKYSGTVRSMVIQISLFAVVIIMPSVFFLYDVYGSLRIKRTINSLLIQPLQIAHNDVLSWDVVKKDKPKELSAFFNDVLSWDVVKKDSLKELRVFYTGREIDSTTAKDIHKQLAEEGLSNYRLMLIRVNMSKEEVARLSMDAAQKLITERLTRDSLRFKPETLPNISSFQAELTSAFPFVESIGLGKVITSSSSHPDHLDTLTHVLLHFSSPQAERTYQKEISRLYNFCTTRLQKDTIVVLAVPKGMYQK